MATVDSPTPLEAAGQIFADVAMTLYSVVELLNDLVNDPRTATAGRITSLAAMVAAAGAMADRGSMACGIGEAMQSQDEWMLSPRSAEAMQLLEARAHSVHTTARKPA